MCNPAPVKAVSAFFKINNQQLKVVKDGPFPQISSGQVSL